MSNTEEENKVVKFFTEEEIQKVILLDNCDCCNCDRKEINYYPLFDDYGFPITIEDGEYPKDLFEFNSYGTGSSVVNLSEKGKEYFKN